MDIAFQPYAEPRPFVYGRLGPVVRIGRRADAIDQWTGARQLQSGQTQLASYDYQAVATNKGDAATRSRAETALIYRFSAC